MVPSDHRLGYDAVDPRSWGENIYHTIEDGPDLRAL